MFREHSRRELPYDSASRLAFDDLQVKNFEIREFYKMSLYKKNHFSLKNDDFRKNANFQILRRKSTRRENADDSGSSGIDARKFETLEDRKGKVKSLNWTLRNLENRIFNSTSTSDRDRNKVKHDFLIKKNRTLRISLILSSTAECMASLSCLALCNFFISSLIRVRMLLQNWIWIEPSSLMMLWKYSN